MDSQFLHMSTASGGDPSPGTNTVDCGRAVQHLIDAGGPAIVFQPTVHLETGKQIGAEALSRFPAEADPRQWFERAAAVGLGADLEMVAARNALTTLDAPTRERLGWEFVGINVSPETLLDPWFEELLGEHIGRHVVLELTSRHDQPAWTMMRTYLDRARELGANIALNALTLQSAELLHRAFEVAPEIIKLDVSYTSTLVDDDRRRGAAEEFLLHCTRRGIFVVGVGVERPHHAEVLRELGVDAAQGYLYGQPQPIDGFDAASDVGPNVTWSSWT
jgi:EAL domain-containing protein (putative c-di-GMP-specific phosphodiesterase class I)